MEKERAATLEATFRALDYTRDGYLAYGEFKKACYNAGLSGDLRLLFNGLDFDGDGHVRARSREGVLYACSVLCFWLCWGGVGL